jgi:hypothetical protein
MGYSFPLTFIFFKMVKTTNQMGILGYSLNVKGCKGIGSPKRIEVGIGLGSHGVSFILVLGYMATFTNLL